MRIGVLSKNIEYWTTRKIIKAGRFRGHDTEFLRTGDVQLRVDETHFDAGDGPYFIEVNASPGFKGLMKATDVDVPGKIIEYAERKARR